MKLIERQSYLNLLKSVMGVAEIKIIMGIRQSGKSELLKSFISYVRQNYPEDNLISIDLANLKYEKLKAYHELNSYIEKHHVKTKKNYVFIDNIQFCNNFESVLSSLHSSGNYDIYITLAYNSILNSNFKTLFSGKAFYIEVFPFSFKEYVEYFNSKDIYAAYGDYRKTGGMSGSYTLYGEINRQAYLKNIFDTLVISDIAQKYKIRNIPLLERIVDFMMNNFSTAVSANKIADTFIINKVKANDKTIGAYIQYLCNAFGFYKIKRYDICDEKYLFSNEKYYIVDSSFIIAKQGNRNPDFAKISENIVAVELLRRGYEIYAGTLYRSSIDFVAIRYNEKMYIQVAEYIDNPEVFKQKYAPLLEIRDAYPKIILARTHQATYQYQGILVADIANWLLKSNFQNFLHEF